MTNEQSIHLVITNENPRFASDNNRNTQTKLVFIENHAKSSPYLNLKQLSAFKSLEFLFVSGYEMSLDWQRLIHTNPNLKLVFVFDSSQKNYRDIFVYKRNSVDVCFISQFHLKCVSYSRITAQLLPSMTSANLNECILDENEYCLSLKYVTLIICIFGFILVIICSCFKYCK